MVKHDTVTGLLAWPLFEDRLHQSIKNTERHQQTLGVLLVDLDNFRLINDALGQEVGDALLSEVGRRLSSCIRQVDSVSRIAKDRFVVLLTQLAKPETALIVSQRILQSIAHAYQIKTHSVTTTACIGIALIPADGRDVMTLLKHAESALHFAKKKGRQQAQFYQQDMQIESERQQAIYASLSQDTFYQAYTMTYQPVIQAVTRATVGMEASFHWDHPEWGRVNQGELMAMAEMQRKVNMISEWQIKQACEQYLVWQARAIQLDWVSVSVSIKQLENMQFVLHLSQLLKSMAFPAQQLLINIQCHAGKISFDVIEKALNTLHYLGVKTAITEVGAASLPLQYIKHFRIDYLMLAPAFVADVAHNERTRAIVQSLSFMAEKLGMDVITPMEGEGVSERLPVL